MTLTIPDGTLRLRQNVLVAQWLEYLTVARLRLN